MDWTELTASIFKRFRATDLPVRRLPTRNNWAKSQRCWCLRDKLEWVSAGTLNGTGPSALPAPVSSLSRWCQADCSPTKSAQGRKENWSPGDQMPRHGSWAPRFQHWVNNGSRPRSLCYPVSNLGPLNYSWQPREPVQSSYSHPGWLKNIINGGAWMH